MKVYCYAHTHWDFEWYFTNSESTIQLIYHMNEVFYALENKLISHYHLDGQLSIVEDYLAHAPEYKEKFIQFVQQGKIIIGPWYTQSDELVIAGESVIRNLYYGINSAKQFGDWMKIGYMPDSFGQSKDMPKILNGFGIKNFLFWRGLSADKCPYREFIWKGVDGSSVLSYNIRNGYFYGPNVIFNDKVDEVESVFLKGCDREIALLPIGADQRNVDYPFLERLEFYTKNTTHQAEYIEKTCEEFFDDLAKEDNLPVVEGELLDPSYSKIHRSIYSSRYDHKYYNDKVERRLIYQLEPLMVMAKNMGLEMHPNALEQFWKKLLMNHAHDSACGCNSDKTNKTILFRFQSVDESTYSMNDYIVRKLAISFPNASKNDLFIFNTLAIKRQGLTKLVISTEKSHFMIQDSEGNTIPHQIISTEKDYRGSVRKNLEDYDPSLFYYVHKVWIKTDLLPLGVVPLKVIETEKGKNISHLSSTVIQDDYLKVVFDNGTISITNKKSQESHTLLIEDSGDDGDTYDYSPPIPDVIEKLTFVKGVSTVTEGELVKTLRITGEFELFTDLVARQSKGSRVKVPYTFDISLHNDSLLRTKLILDNTVKDHRMRLILSTNIESSVSVADTLCGVIERDNVPAHIDDWREIGWREEPSPIYPTLHFVGLENQKKSTFALLKGIKEYEILDNSAIALTLFRSVAFLGKPELVRRPGIASGKEFKYVPTPESQLNGVLIFKNAFYIGEKIPHRQVKSLWLEYAINSLYYQMQTLNVNNNTLQYFVSNPLFHGVEREESMINTDALNVEVHSIMPRDKNSFFIRFLNNSMENCDGGKVTFVKTIRYQHVDLAGTPLSPEKQGETIDLGDFNKEGFKTYLCSF